MSTTVTPSTRSIRSSGGLPKVPLSSRAVTLIVGLRGADGVVLACDSQGTKGELKHATRKLFKTKGGVIWGTAGQLAGSQTLYTELEQLDLEPNPRREDAKAAIRNAMRAATRELIPGRRNREEWFEGLFGWYDGTDKRHYLMLARHDGHVEFMTPTVPSAAADSSGSLATAGLHSWTTTRCPWRS
jgi:hypothetical protein